MHKFLFALSIVLLFSLPAPLAAHEVYLLDSATISDAVDTASPNPLIAYIGNEGSFFFWAFVSIIVTLTVFFASTFRWIESRTSPLFARLKRFAHPLVRFTVAATLITSGLTATLYGQELPFESVFGTASGLAQIAVLIIGVGIFIGLQTRILALCALILYAVMVGTHGFYGLTYIHHAAAYVFLGILGGGPWTLDHHLKLGWHFRKRLEQYAAYAFPLLRVGFGASIMFAAFYAKFLHSNLALSVVNQYNLGAYFPFDPLFIVLGAFIIEFLAGFMLLIGVEIRWTALFLVFWLTLAHLYFPEAWYVHIAPYGFGAALLCHGYDRFTLEGRFFKKRRLEPAL